MRCEESGTERAEFLSEGTSHRAAHVRAGDATGAAPGAAASLSFQDLTFARGSHTVIDGLTYQVSCGKVTCLVGCNGCGKSTLLGLAGGMLRPRSGDMRLFGRSLGAIDARERARALAILTQGGPAPAMRVRDFVALGRFPYRGAEEAANDGEAVGRALGLVGLTDLADAWVDRLSGGQRQRARIALVAAQETPVLLMDEPTTYLDAAGCHEVLALARALAHEGRTVLTVIHDLDLALRYADEIAVMDGGRIVCAGTPEDVLDQGVLQRVFNVRIRAVEDEEGRGYLLFPR